MGKKKIASQETNGLSEKKICRKCGFQSAEMTIWICPRCHADAFEREANFSPEDLANLEAGRPAF